MIKSMTGFGRAEDTLNGREIAVELRSVNHRYLEVSLRVPRAYSFLEEKIRHDLQQRVSRGKIDLGISIQQAKGAGVAVEANVEAARGYYRALTEIAEQLKIEETPDLATVARFPDIFSVKSDVPDEEEVYSDVRAVLDAALAGFLMMREQEGGRLSEDISGRLAAIEAMADAMEQDSPLQIARYRDKLAARMKQVLESADIDENRILLEAALYADKSAVDEETVRLKSHIAQFREILLSGEPAGRKLDFLVQELNREVNTIGSKAQDAAVTARVVEAKSEIEKIREQIQNIE